VSRLRIYKISASESLDNVHNVAASMQLAASAGPRNVFCQMGYNHMGDPDFYDGHLYVILSHDDSHNDECPKPSDAPPAFPPAILELDANLTVSGFSLVPRPFDSTGNGGGWVAINPRDGRLYTAFDFGHIYVYRLNMGLVPTSPLFNRQWPLDYIGRVELPMGFSGDYWDQGGAFSPNGTFFYVSDNGSLDGGDDSSVQTGIHAFRMVPFPDGSAAVSPTSATPSDRIISNAPVGTSPGIEKLSVGGDANTGYFRIGYDPRYTVPIEGSDLSRQYELEGATIYRGADGLMYVLALMLDNEGDEDDVSMYWWYTNEP
jgi:hypothetical protein